MLASTRSVLPVSILVLACPLLAGDGGGRQTFRSSVDLVRLTVTVTDRSDRLIPDLQKEDFLVLDEGQPAAIDVFVAERVPVSLGILLDVSQSMQGAPLQAAALALRELLSLLGPDDQVFLAAFHEHYHLLSDWTVPSPAVIAPLADVMPYGRTPLFDAVAEAVPLLSEGRHPKKALVVLSDGKNSHGRLSLSEVTDGIQRAEALVYAVGVDSQVRMSGLGPNLERTDPGRANVGILRALTDRTGGRTFPIRRLQAMPDATRRIADELRTQYLLGFAPADGSGDRVRRIEVRVRDRDYRVRTRRAYLTSSVSP